MRYFVYNRHTLRRRRKLVGLRAISMCGISVQPLGYDDDKNEYWKFPFSPDLFVCYYSDRNNGFVDKDQLDFARLIKKDLESNPNAMKVEDVEKENANKVWVRINDVEVMKKIAACLGTSRHETMLRNNMITELLVGRMNEQSKKNTFSNNSRPNQSSTSATNVNDEAEMEDDNNEDEEEEEEDNSRPITSSAITRQSENAPHALKLFVNKGQGINDYVHIQEEKVYTDEYEKSLSDNEDNEDDDASQYFSFSNRK
jgi:hypothetical protein